MNINIKKMPITHIVILVLSDQCLSIPEIADKIKDLGVKCLTNKQIANAVYALRRQNIVKNAIDYYDVITTRAVLNPLFCLTFSGFNRYLALIQEATANAIDIADDCDCYEGNQNANEKLEEQNKTINELNAKITTLSEDNAEYKRQCSNFTTIIHNLRNRINELSRDLVSKTNECEKLQNNYDYISDSLKKMSDWILSLKNCN